MRNKNVSKQLRCPICGEIANLLHFYSVEYVAPVVLEDGVITINHDRETINDSYADKDVCHCGKCGSSVQIDDIQIVDADEAEKEAA